MQKFTSTCKLHDFHELRELRRPAFTIGGQWILQKGFNERSPISVVTGLDVT